MTGRCLDRELGRAWKLLGEGDGGAAAELLRAAVARPGLDPGAEADARYVLGLALVGSGDREGAAREWLRVLGLDAAGDAADPLLAPDEFEAVAEAALRELPDELLQRLRSVAVLVDERPSPEMVAGGMDPRILGLFHGVPLSRRSTSFGSPYADTIHLFRANLERTATSRERLVAQVRVTVLHETAHFFGYGEAGLRRLGLG